MNEIIERLKKAPWSVKGKAEIANLLMLADSMSEKLSREEFEQCWFESIKEIGGEDFTSDTLTMYFKANEYEKLEVLKWLST